MKPVLPSRLCCGFAAFLLVVAASTVVHGQQSAYLPAAGRTELTVVHTYWEFDEIWVGDQRISTQDGLGSAGKQQRTTLLTVERGLSDRFAADLTLGYATAEIDGFGTDRGATDFQMGLRYQVVDEAETHFTGLPTLAIRVGGIIGGTYKEDTPASIGDGASGCEVSLLAARALGSRVGVFGDVGYRWRDHGVPDEWLASVGFSARARTALFSLALRYEGSVSGLDIFGPGFGTRGGFPQTNERNLVSYVSAGLPVGRVDWFQIYAGRSLDGRNTGNKRIFGASLTLGF